MVVGSDVVINVGGNCYFLFWVVCWMVFDGSGFGECLYWWGIVFLDRFGLLCLGMKFI